MTDLDIENIKKTLIIDPGNQQFAAYADHLRTKGKALEAIEVCLAGLSANPCCHQGRLVFARVLCEQSYLPFAINELEILYKALPDNKPIKKLLDKLSPTSTKALEPKAREHDPHDQPTIASNQSPISTTQTIAEAEFSFDDMDLLESQDKEKK